MAQHFTTSDGLRLAYDDAGDGPAVLCLAGLTRNMADFRPVVAAFADRARILRLDARGRGQSDRDPDWRNYNLLREAHDALDLLDHLGLARAAVLGTSRGGLIAMTLAGGHRDRLSGALLNDIGPVIEDRGLAAIMSYLGEAPPYRDHEDAADRLTVEMAARFPGVARDRWLDWARHYWVEGPGGLELGYDPMLRRAVIEQSAAGAPADPWPAFDRLDGVPLGLIRGANSDILSADTAAEMRRRRPDMIYAEVPDRGHVPFLDEPEARQAIAAWLELLA